MDGVLSIILFALALCADSFAVSLCSSVTLKRISWKSVGAVALSFALVQGSMLMAGWGVGDLFSGLLGRMARLVGFALLMYVAAEMIVSALRKDHEILDLNGLKHIMLGALATSMDALAAGASLSLTAEPAGIMLWRSLAVALLTALSVVAGICCGHRLGHRFGKWAEALGGIILILLALHILIS